MGSKQEPPPLAAVSSDLRDKRSVDRVFPKHATQKTKSTRRRLGVGGKVDLKSNSGQGAYQAPFRKGNYKVPLFVGAFICLVAQPQAESGPKCWMLGKKAGCQQTQVPGV